MKGLRDKDREILYLINQAMPIGVNPNKMLAEVKLTPQNLNGYLKKLSKKGFITKRKEGWLALYFTTEQGKNALSLKAVQAPKPFTKPKLQRPHALQVNALLFRTSWDRLEPTLSALSIPYHKELKGNLIRFTWQGRELRATSQYLYTIVELKPMPLNVPIEEVKQKAILEAGAYLEAFLAHTGLRCKRDRLGMLALGVRYWENGYPGNEIAEESLKDKSRIVYAYDKAGKVRAWADSSLGDLKELETNSEVVDTQMKAFIQAVENSELKPYEDAMQARRDIQGLKELAGMDRDSIHQIIQNQLAFGKDLREHVKAIKKLSKMAEEVSQALRQRRL